MDAYTACFIGHRTIGDTPELRKDLCTVIERLIVEEGVDTFLFGSRSAFDCLCRELVTEMRERYPHIRRVYVRAEFPSIREEYRQYLLASYEDTYYPKSVIGAGRAAYVERNYAMIDHSRFCVIYYDEAHVPTTRKSGAKTALDYARRREKRVIVLPAISK